MLVSPTSWSSRYVSFAGNCKHLLGVCERLVMQFILFMAFAVFLEMNITLGFLFFFSFCLFRAVPTAYGGSRARGLIGAVAAGLHHSHSKQCQIQAASATHTTAHSISGSLIHWARPGIESTTSRFLVGFVSAVPWQKLLGFLTMCLYAVFFLILWWKIYHVQVLG